MDLIIDKIQELYLLHRFSSQSHISCIAGCVLLLNHFTVYSNQGKIIFLPINLCVRLRGGRNEEY